MIALIRTGLLLVGTLSAAVTLADMQFLNLHSNRNDRFYAGGDNASIGAAFDWSGVGQASDNTWVTMISPTYFVTAHHQHPGAGATVTFYIGNSTSSPSHTYIVDKLGQPALDEWCAALTGKLRALHPADALCQTIQLAGEKLAPVLPHAADDVNELSDALVILDR